MGLIKMNGVNYWGSAYGQGIIAPMIYSDEEREVGVWRDGKPLYQKTIHHVNTTSSFEDYVTITTISNIDTVASIDTVVRRQLESGSLWFSVPARPENGDSYRFSVAVRTYNEAVQYRIDQYGTQITDMYITIRYTKTTDVAGSGIWNGQGGIAHHYSTNETVIGTWIDGKPLYERTFELTQQLDLTQDTWVKSELDQGTMKGLFYVLFTNDLGACLNNIAGGFIDNKIAFNSPRTTGFAPAENAKVTLQYTKTTD